jgi:hypothetical protein
LRAADWRDRWFLPNGRRELSSPVC